MRIKLLSFELSRPLIYQKLRSAYGTIELVRKRINMPGSPKKILVVEDERPLSHALVLKLTNEGYEVTPALNGQECLDYLEKNTYDIVLLDLMMPVVDGFQVLDFLQKKGPMPYVVVLSNLSQPEDEARVKALGAKKYFIKSETPLSVIVEEVKKA